MLVIRGLLQELCRAECVLEERISLYVCSAWKSDDDVVFSRLKYCQIRNKKSITKNLSATMKTGQRQDWWWRVITLVPHSIGDGASVWVDNIFLLPPCSPRLSNTWDIFITSRAAPWNRGNESALTTNFRHLFHNFPTASARASILRSCCLTLAFPLRCHALRWWNRYCDFPVDQP